MTENTRFFWYRVKCLHNKKPIEIKNVLEKKDFLKHFNNIPIEDKEKRVINKFTLLKLEDDFYYGKIIRTKDTEDFFVEKGNLLDKLANLLKKGKEKRRIGEINKDVCNFIFHLEKDKIEVLMQKGYQLGGMGKLKELLRKILGNEAEDISCKAMQIEKKRGRLKSLFDKKLLKMKLKFPKNPEVPKDTVLENTIRGIQSIMSDKYYIDITITTGRLGKKTKEVIPVFGDVVHTLLGKDATRNIANDMDIELPEFLDNFSIDYMTTSGEVIKNEDILENFEKIEINIATLALNDDEKLSKILLEKFREKLSTLK